MDQRRNMMEFLSARMLLGLASRTECFLRNRSFQSVLKIIDTADTSVQRAPHRVGACIIFILLGCAPDTAND